DEMKGQIPCGFVVLNAGAERKSEELEAEVVDLVRKRIGPVAALRTVLAVPRLPKTRSGKILRATMQKIADGKAWNMPATIDDPKGQIPCGFVVLTAGAERKSEELEAEVVDLVRKRIGPVAALRTVLAVPRLPKTRSGKILRATMQKIADGKAWNMPATIDDP